MSNYWDDRIIKAQNELTNREEKKVNAQMRKYYRRTFNNVLDEFEKTYTHLLLSIEDGREPTPADLYKLDRYWNMQGQIREQLYLLGDRQVDTLGKAFERNFLNVYNSFALEGKPLFSTIDASAARQMINQVWCADGQTWSNRVWGNIDRLQQTLNDGLIECVVSGKKTTDLKNTLQERFGVSYHRANTLVRTELAHIQTQAAAKRYEDYGIEKYEILGNDDDSCGNHKVDCHKMNGKQFYYAEMVVGENAPPFHPNCKCCIVPVIE